MQLLATCNLEVISDIILVKLMVMTLALEVLPYLEMDT